MGERIETPHSSNVLAYEYDPKTQTLTVHFKSGGSYDYAGVGEDKVAQLKRARSVGSFIHEHIKSQHTATRRK